MEIELCAVSGYNNVTRNMSAIKIGEEVIIIDMGVNIEALVNQESEDNTRILSVHEMIDNGALPDDRVINEWRDSVKAIILGHCHLDHIAAVKYLAAKYNCPIIGSPYTIEVLKTLLEDDEVKLPNKYIKVELDNTIKISNNIKIELISMSHSTLQCALVTVHTPEGIIVYANDFKFDNSPVLGEKPNYKRLKALGDSKKVLAVIMESMYAHVEGNTPTEEEAKEKLKKVLEECDNKKNAIFITTFSSQLARIKSAIDFAKKIKRKPVIIGRSMAKYIEAAERLKLVNFSKQAEIVKYGGHRNKKLKQIEQDRGKYLVICTGGQGEPGSILDKIIKGNLHFNFNVEDAIIFSNSIIPVPTNIARRKNLELELENRRIKIYKNIHSSGHARSEDSRYFIQLLKPKYLIPSQGEKYQEDALQEIAEEEGIKEIIRVKDGDFVKLVE